MKNYKDEETEKKFLGENEEEKTEDEAPVSSFKSKMANFFYHYKWHTVVALVLIFAITIPSVQMCRKVDIDSYIMYAGSKEIGRTAKDGETPLYIKMQNSLKRASADIDGDGQKTVAFLTLFALTTDEIREIESNPEQSVNRKLLENDRKTLTDTMMCGEYYVCMFSPGIFEQLKEVGGVSAFANCHDYIAEENSVEFYTDTAVYLRSTDFYQLPGICELPEDTLVCLRIKSALSSHFGKEKNEELYKNSEDIFRNILNYEVK